MAMSSRRALVTSRRPATLGRRLRSVYVWHRWLGVAALLFVLLFALTGLALNHTETLKLDERHLQQPLWLDVYDLNDAVEIQGIHHSGRWFSHVHGRLYVDENYVSQGPVPFAVEKLEHHWLVASSSQLQLLDERGQLLESINAAQLPGRLVGMGVKGNQLILHTPYASFIGDLQSLQWRYLARPPLPNTQTPATPPDAIVAAIRKDIHAHALSLERVLLDLHSGRLFGLLGVYVMDMAAIVLIILGLSGLWLWIRYLRSQRRIRLRRKVKQAV